MGASRPHWPVFCRTLDFFHCFGGLSFLPVLFIPILNDQRDAAVGRIEGTARFAQKLVGEAPYLRNLLRAKTVLLHQPARRVGAVSRKFPVAIVSFAAIGLGICVSFNRNLVGNLSQLGSQEASNFRPFSFGVGFPRSKRVPVADSSSSIRSPSAVTLISIWFFNLLSSGMWWMAFLEHRDAPVLP
jgi:hypothetical protein